MKYNNFIINIVIFIAVSVEISNLDYMILKVANYAEYMTSLPVPIKLVVFLCMYIQGGV